VGQLVTPKFRECGIDYFTATKQRSAGSKKFLQRIESIVYKEASRGNELKPWGMSGYKGWRAGSAEYGVRRDGYIARVSSGLANEEWAKLYALCDNVSRIDLQETIRTDSQPRNAIARDYSLMSRWAKSSKRHAQVCILRHSNGSATLYSGQRSSAVFLREYDKGLETGLDYYKGCVRREAELKGALAMSIASQLHRSRARRRAISAGVQTFFEVRRGVRWSQSESLLESTVPRARSDDERKLKWLAESVRSSVQVLLAHGRELEVLTALDLRHLAQPQAKHRLRVA